MILALALTFTSATFAAFDHPAPAKAAATCSCTCADCTCPRSAPAPQAVVIMPEKGWHETTYHGRSVRVYGRLHADGRTVRWDPAENPHVFAAPAPVVQAAPIAYTVPTYSAPVYAAPAYYSAPAYRVRYRARGRFQQAGAVCVGGVCYGP